MKNYGLSESQLFTLTRKNLEKRISQYYRETNDGDGALECLIALQVREELTKTYVVEKLKTLFTQFIKEPLAGLVGS
ncbi:hypothetical protein [Enterococcus avium]|uniref:hypothetical protein n=1 Tax=Enterococcus avium TaxID=33945 RepID=UPI0022E42A4C|nr:hypothetical protein [Enterococcus avium]